MPTPPASCLACGATSLQHWAAAKDLEYHSSEDNYDFWECDACGSLSISPVPSDKLGEIYPPNYYSFGGESQSIIYRIKGWLDRRLCASLLQEIPGTELQALDVGGGDGEQLTVVRQSDSRVRYTQVVDMDESAEERAKANGHAYHRGLIQDFDSDTRFDFVLLLNVIEHVDDPESVLRTVAKLLAPGGLVLVKTPNIDSLDARMYRLKNWGGLHCPRHWVLFNQQGFRSMTDRAGLEIAQFRYTQGAPFWALSWLFVLAKRGLISITPERPGTSHPLFPLFTVVGAGFDIARGLFGAKTSQMIAVLRLPQQ